MTTEDARKLFVAGLPESMTEDVLRQLFEATGSQVVDVSMPKDRATGRPRGFGFVTLETGEQAERARSALDGSVQAGRVISVRPFQGGNARRDVKGDSFQSSTPVEERTLYVGNLPYDATVDEVEQVLARAGVSPVIRVHLPMGPDGRPRGFGFVTLASPDAVLQAIPAMQNADLRGRRVMVKVAHPRGATPAPATRGPMAAPNAGVPQTRTNPGNIARGDSVPPPKAYRAPQPSTEFDEEEEGGDGSRAGKPKAAAVARGGAKAGKAAPPKRKGERTADDRRSRGGGASWQRWEDWDDD
jgi:RNA recognition motif-containing protein